MIDEDGFLELIRRRSEMITGESGGGADDGESSGKKGKNKKGEDTNSTNKIYFL